MQQIFTNLLNIGIRWLDALQENLPRIVTGLLVLLLAWLLARAAAGVLRRSLKLRETDPEFAALIVRLLNGTILVLGILVALEQVGADVTALLTGLGILGFTIGFALQDVSKNFVAGLLVLLSQPFELGDTVEVGGYTGKVKDIRLRDMAMETIDGRYVRIPNAEVITQSLVNYSRTHRRRVELKIGVAYDADLENVRRVAVECLQAVPGLMADPAPDVVFDSFGDWAIHGAVYYWVNLAQTTYGAGQTAGVQAVRTAFEQAGIEMPSPAHAVVPQPAAPKGETL